MLKWLVIVLISGVLLDYGWSDVVITELSGTNNAKYGTSHSLQCNFNYENETGVEIKWFYNGDDQIFLWIPNRTKPNPMESWKVVLDTNDTTSDHDVKHSVIHFKELNFNLTGNYTCKVTGDEHEDARTQRMVVYRPASFVDFDLISEENTTVTLICSAFEIYPKPIITVRGLYLTESNGTIPIYLKNETVEGDQDTLVNITSTFIFSKDDLIAPVIELTCDMAVGDTNYSVTKRLEYTKSGYETTTTDNPEYYLNDTTISPEYEISTNKSALDNTKKQGGISPHLSGPCLWQLMFLPAIMYVRQGML